MKSLQNWKQREKECREVADTAKMTPKSVLLVVWLGGIAAGARPALPVGVCRRSCKHADFLTLSFSQTGCTRMPSSLEPSREVAAGTGEGNP